MARLAYENRLLHLLLCELALPPILAMTVTGNQVVLVVSFFDPAKLAEH